MHPGESISRFAAGKELDISLTTPFPDHGSLRQMSDKDRLDFESLMLYLRLSFLLAPLLLIAAYGMRAVMPAIDVEMAVLADCAVVWSLLRWFPALALRGQMALRGIDLTVTFVALHFVHLFLGNAYYDSVYLLFVVAATATHGRRGTYLVATVSALAILAGRTVLILGHVFPFQVRHITDSLFYAFLFLTTGITTEFLMRKSAETVALRDREPPGALQVAEKLVQVVRQPRDIEGRLVSVGTSIGISLYPDQTDDVDVLLQQADSAMYAAKRSGSGHSLFSVGETAQRGAVGYLVAPPID